MTNGDREKPLHRATAASGCPWLGRSADPEFKSEGSARLWDTASGREILVLKGHKGPILRAVFSQDGRRITTGGRDRIAQSRSPTDKGNLLQISCNLSSQTRLVPLKDPFRKTGVNSPIDTQLMQSVREGELENLAPLFERHHVMLYNHYIRLTRDRELSEDLVQEVFYRIIKYRNIVC